MKKRIIFILLTASLSCLAENDPARSPFDYRMEVQEIKSELLPFGVIGSGFNYQGQLLESGSTVNGNFDFAFILYDSPTGGIQVGSTVVINSHLVEDGLFSIENIDFGNASYLGDELWISVTVRETGNPGSETTLSPRQKISSVPYAVQADYLGPLNASEGDLLKFSAGSWTPTSVANSGVSPWTVAGNDIIFSSGSTGTAKIDGTKSVNSTVSGLGLLNVGKDGDHLRMDKDDIQRVFNNLPNTLYINWYGGDLVLASPNRKTTIRGDANIRGKVYQDITSDGIMKYMVNAVCGPSASILKFSNNVDSLGTITVTPSTSGKCTINFPDDISDRYWQVSAVFSTGNRGVNCSQSGVSNNQLSCTRFNSSTATEISGEIMLLVY